LKETSGRECATIRTGELVFRVWAGPAGIRRLELPPLSSRRAKRNLKQEVRFTDAEIDDATGGHVRELAVFLSEMLSGKQPGAAPDVDLEGMTSFTRQVLAEVERIPWGAVSSYGEVAAAAGMRGSARAAGGAVGRNPVPLVIPCHRVVRSDGSTGGWSGAPGWKEWLLSLEGGAEAAELAGR
jgi:O-6-methylguanine DNA methyltransferase